MKSNKLAVTIELGELSKLERHNIRTYLEDHFYHSYKFKKGKKCILKVKSLDKKSLRNLLADLYSMNVLHQDRKITVSKIMKTTNAMDEKSLSDTGFNKIKISGPKFPDIPVSSPISNTYVPDVSMSNTHGIPLYTEVDTLYNTMNDYSKFPDMKKYINDILVGIKDEKMGQIPARGYFIWNKSWYEVDGTTFGPTKACVFNDFDNDDYLTSVYVRGINKDGKPSALIYDVINGEKYNINVDAPVIPLYHLDRKDIFQILIFNMMRNLYQVPNSIAIGGKENEEN